MAKPRPNLASAPVIRSARGVWQVPARREASLTAPRAFCFLGQRGDLDQIGWDGEQYEKLWRYNQHYFDDLNARDSDLRKAWHQSLLMDWVEKNLPGQGNGWEPYPTSLRIVNWVKWALAGNELSQVCLQSLAVQVRWLTKRLEFHLLGNHLFANAKALIFASLFFEGAEADGWLKTGLHILESEISEQILHDGGHFELSTMYHALALEDVLDLYNLLICYEQGLPKRALALLDVLREKIILMLEWLATMRHPDGEIGFFNDAALGVAPSCSELDSYAEKLGFCASESTVISKSLPYSGYVRLQTNNALALLDIAPVGPDYLPGHAHADTLSFELSLFGQRVLVNSGTSCYGVSPERLRQRGTVAHNTVTVAGENSSEVWAGFRVARRARPFSPVIDIASEPLLVECAHDGYKRLNGKPIHRRKWLLSEKLLIIEDKVGKTSFSSQARFHFHPAVKLEPGFSENQGVVLLPKGQNLVWEVEVGHAHIESTTWHPQFGFEVTNQCLVVDLEQGKSTIKWSWT